MMNLIKSSHIYVKSIAISPKEYLFNQFMNISSPTPKLLNNEAIPAIIQIPIVNPPNEQTNETSDADHISCKQMFDNYYNRE